MYHLFLISQSECTGYDSYDSAVVVAENEEEAARIHPNGSVRWMDGKWMRRLFGHARERSGTEWVEAFEQYDWASDPKAVDVQPIGVLVSDEYKLGDVICSSFNAG